MPGRAHDSAYGFSLTHAPLCDYLNAGLPSHRALDVTFEGWPSPPPPEGWSQAWLGPSWVAHASSDVHRIRCFRDPPHRNDEFVHPGLGAAAVVATLQLGGEALHAGAVFTADGVVALLAERGGGKTTTLGFLASRHGLGVLTDDQLMVREDTVHAGPRCLDLRAPAAAALDLLERTVVVRTDQRHRYRLPAVPVDAELAGFVLLDWGDRLSVTTVRPSERLGELARHRMLPGHGGGRRLPLDLAALPMRRLTRPRGHDELPSVARALLGG